MKENEAPLPQDIHLPKNYSREINEALEEGHLAGRAKTKFISKVADAIHFHNLYPSREEYNFIRVAQMVVNKYPFMSSGSGSGYVSI